MHLLPVGSASDVRRVAPERLGNRPGMSPTASPRPLAVVTGGSSGIGRELARQLAERGHDVVLAGDDDAGTKDTARALETYGTTITPFVGDLTDPDMVMALHKAVVEIKQPVDVLCLNAGVGANGAFSDGTSLVDDLRLIDLTVRSAGHLTKLELHRMVEAGAGRVLFTSSIASTMPGPYQAIYNATKAFVSNFAAGIRAEVKEAGVTVTYFMPGPVDTSFFGRANLGDTKMGQGPKDAPEDVASQALEALFAGKPSVVAGNPLVKAQAYADRFLPEPVKAAAHRVLARPGGAK